MKDIDLYRRFNEGSELGDAVKALIDARSILGGINCDHEEQLILLVVKKLIRDYCEMGRNRELSWEEYDEIDPELYKHILGGANKLTKEEY